MALTNQQLSKLQEAVSDSFRNYSGDWSLHIKNVQFLADLIGADYDDVYNQLNDGGAMPS